MVHLSNALPGTQLISPNSIAVSLTIEPPESVGQPEPDATPSHTKRMRALMSVKGYVLPDPHTPNRLTVWFTGGQLSPARLASRGDGGETDDEDQAEYSQPQSAKNEEPAEGYGGFDDWAAMFSKGKWRKTLGERARAMAAKLLLGADVPHKMEDDGHMKYHLHRPVGGHGRVYVDVSIILLRPPTYCFILTHICHAKCILRHHRLFILTKISLLCEDIMERFMPWLEVEYLKDIKQSAEI